MMGDQKDVKHSWRYWFILQCHMETEMSLTIGILVVLVCIHACSTLGECHYEAIDVTLDEFDMYTTLSFDPMYDAFSILNNTMPHLAYTCHST